MSPEGRLTKAEAALSLGVDARTIERLASRGDLTAYPRAGFPTLYSLADVERLALARQTGVRPVILAADRTHAGNGHGALVPHAADPSPLEPLLVEVLQGLALALRHGPTGPTGPTATTTGPTPETWFVTIREAAAIVGMGPKFLRRQIAEGHLRTERQGAVIKIDREELAAWRQRRRTGDPR